MQNAKFGEPGSLIRFIGRTAPIAIAAMGQYFVIVSGEFDLSMGALVTTQVVMAGNLIGQDEGRILPVMLLMLGVGVADRRAQRTGVRRCCKVPSFIVTLGMMLALADWSATSPAAPRPATRSTVPPDRPRRRSRTSRSSTSSPTRHHPGRARGRATWLMRRPFGRTLIAVGDNPDAAELAGTSVWWVKTRAFMLSSMSATVAGIILVGYAGVHPSVGKGYEFTAITAVVLGGVVLGGGRGWVLSAAAGAFALELLFTLLNS